MRYLVKIRQAKHNKVTHVWDGKDTACRMASTRGLFAELYRVEETRDEDIPMCNNCMRNIEIDKHKNNSFPLDYKT